MTNETIEKLARSLTAETIELLPFLPYLLQDLWELGSNPEDIIKLIKMHMPISKDSKILDLACGKGAVAIRIAQSLGVKVFGFDIIPEFIDYANQKAKELNVNSLCHFACSDANDIINIEKNYDCVIFAAAGNILGTPRETLIKLLKTIKPQGFILIDEAYLLDNSNNEDIKYKNYKFITREKWHHLFRDSGLRLVEEITCNENFDFDSDNKAIAKRADELIVKHPEKRNIFLSYIQSQLNECRDLENSIAGVSWMLQSMCPVEIRLEEENDYRRVEELTREAFWNLHVPGCNEHLLVHNLRKADVFLKELDFVATHDNKIVGNIMYAESKIINIDKEYIVLTFGPVSVLPEYQKMGIGLNLITHTIELAKKMEYKAIIIYGYPDYYKKFGFKSSKEYNITNKDKKYPAALLVLELYPNALKGIEGIFDEGEAYRIDSNEFEEFDKGFVKKEKTVTESQKSFLIIANKYL